MKYELPRSTGNALLDGYLRALVEKLNASDTEMQRRLAALDAIDTAVKGLEKSIEEQKAILGNQEKLLKQIKAQVQANRSLFAATKNDITLLGRGLEVAPFALQIALQTAGENIEWIR